MEPDLPGRNDGNGQQSVGRLFRPGVVLALAAGIVAGACAFVAEASAQEIVCPAELEMLVERPYAARAGVDTGSTVFVRARPDVNPCPARVAGLFEPPPDPSRLIGTRPRVLLHLPHLQTLAGRTGDVDYFTVQLRRGVDPAVVAGELEPLLVGTQVFLTSEVTDRASATFRVVSRFHRAIAGITLVAGGVFLACIMVLKVQERRTVVAAARLAGIPRRILLGWTVAEAALLSALGGGAGLGVGFAGSAVVNAYYQRAYDTTLVFSVVTGEMVVQALVLAVVLGMAAGVVAGLRMFASDPLEQLGA